MIPPDVLISGVVSFLVRVKILAVLGLGVQGCRLNSFYRFRRLFQHCSPKP